MKNLTILPALLAFTASVAQQQTSTGVARIAVPDVKGVLELNVGPTTWKTTLQNDGKLIRLDAAPRADRVQVTAFLWQVGFAANPADCKNEAARTMNQTQVKRANVQESTSGQMARVEYMIPEYNGAPVNQKNVDAYLGARDLCAGVHVAKLLFVPSDQKLLDDVLNSVRLLPDESASPQDKPGQDQVLQGSKSYLFDGTMAYLNKDFATAAAQLQQALDLEKQKRTIGRDDFRALIDNLAVSYRFIQNPEKSKEVLDYGLTQDPDYPLFHYDMACYYGEKGNMNQALDELRRAYQNRANLSPSDRMADPLQDSCFGKFLRNKKFVSAVQQMQTQ